MTIENVYVYWQTNLTTFLEKKEIKMISTHTTKPADIERKWYVVDASGVILGRLSAEIAKRIQDEMVYPGQVKITVIRETRSIAFAK